MSYAKDRAVADEAVKMLTNKKFRDFEKEILDERGYVKKGYLTTLDDEPVSNCCGAPIYENTDICTECKEHCSEEETDEKDYPHLFGYKQ